jgi:hypothetical protein
VNWVGKNRRKMPQQEGCRKKGKNRKGQREIEERSKEGGGGEREHGVVGPKKDQ